MNLRICLSDDEPIVLNTLNDFLVDLNCEVSLTSSGEELLSGLGARGQRPDVIIVDLGMPGLSGVELVREVHGRCPDIPIIAMSGLNSPLGSQDAIANGVFGYLRKPVRLSELELMLVRLSERHKGKKRSASVSQPDASGLQMGKA